METIYQNDYNTILVDRSLGVVTKKYRSYCNFIREAFFLKMKIQNSIPLLGIMPGEIHLPLYYNDLGCVRVNSLKFKNILVRILQSLSCCLMKQVIHLDVKTSNILVSKNGDDAVLSDFDGSSVIVVDEENYSLIYRINYTEGYRPPECSILSRYHVLSDIWALGIVCFETLLGMRAPTYDDGNIKYANFTKEENEEMGIYHDDTCDSFSYGDVIVDPVLLDFLSHMLALDPEKRWTPDRLLMHPYLSIPVNEPKLTIEDYKKHWIDTSDTGGKAVSTAAEYIARQDNKKRSPEFYNTIANAIIMGASPSDKDSVFLFLS